MYQTFQNQPRFVNDKNLLVFFRFTVLTAVHLQNANAKFHKVQQKHYSGEAENVYISVRQIYSGQYVPNFTTIGQVFQTLYKKNWCVFFGSQCRMQNLRRVCKTSGPILSRLWTKVHEIFWDDVANSMTPRAFKCPCPIVYATFRSENFRHAASKSSKIRTNVNVLVRIFDVRKTPTFLRQIFVSVIHCPSFDKDWIVLC